MARQNRTFRFSHRSIEALPAQKPNSTSPNYEVTDAVESGLKVAIFKSGRRSFRHRYSYLGRKRLMTLGEFPAVNVERARERVRENKSLLAEDIDPLEERQARRDAIDFATFATEHFLPHAKETTRSYKDIVSRVNMRLIPNFGEKKLEEISKQSISIFHQSLRSTPPTANRCLSLMSAMFRYAKENGLATDNPCKGIAKIKENAPRLQVLNSDEMQRFMSALRESMTTPQGKAIFLLLATGKRKMEILSMRWSNVDLVKRQVYIPMTKSGKPGFALLNDQAFEVLNQMKKERNKAIDFVFPSTSKSGHLLDIRRTFQTIKSMAKIENFTIHSMRKVYASILLNQNIPIVQIRDLLGHADIRTTMIYAHLDTKSLQNANNTAGEELQRFMT